MTISARKAENLLWTAVLLVTIAGCTGASTRTSEQRLNDARKLDEQAADAYEAGNYDDALVWAQKRHDTHSTGTSFMLLAQVESALGNAEESRVLAKKAALLGNEIALDTLRDQPPREVALGTPVEESNPLCDLVVERAVVLPEWTALQLRIEHEGNSRRVSYAIDAITDSAGNLVGPYDALAGTRAVLGAEESASFSTIVATGTPGVEIAFKCGQHESLAVASLENPGIEAAIASFNEDSDADEPRTSVRIAMSENGYEIPVTINNSFDGRFLLDSTVSDVTISSELATALLEDGTISHDDLLPTRADGLADGSAMISRQFILRSIAIGSLVLENIRCSVQHDLPAQMRVGRNVLSELGDYSIDDQGETLSIY